MITRLLSTASLVLALGTAPALAQDWADWDTNDDTFLDRDEFTEGFGAGDYYDSFDANDDALLDTTELGDATYEMMDMDGDGTLTVDEWDTWVDTRVGEDAVNLSVAEWDEDGDNIISREEFNDDAVADSLYADYDANTDEFWDEEEFGAATFDYADFDDDDLLGEDEFLFDDFGI